MELSYCTDFSKLVDYIIDEGIDANFGIKETGEPLPLFHVETFDATIDLDRWKGVTAIVSGVILPSGDGQCRRDSDKGNPVYFKRNIPFGGYHFIAPKEGILSASSEYVCRMSDEDFLYYRMARSEDVDSAEEIVREIYPKFRLPTRCLASVSDITGTIAYDYSDDDEEIVQGIEIAVPDSDFVGWLENNIVFVG